MNGLVREMAGHVDCNGCAVLTPPVHGCASNSLIYSHLLCCLAGPGGVQVTAVLRSVPVPDLLANRATNTDSGNRPAQLAVTGAAGAHLLLLTRCHNGPLRPHEGDGGEQRNEWGAAC